MDDTTMTDGMRDDRVTRPKTHMSDVFWGVGTIFINFIQSYTPVKYFFSNTDCAPVIATSQ